jgi:hypothetical protein
MILNIHSDALYLSEREAKNWAGDFFTSEVILTTPTDLPMGLRKSVRRRACALWRAWRFLIYKYIDHIMKCEHECAIPRLPRAMAFMVIFSYFIRPIELTVDNGAFHARKECYMLPKKELEIPIHVCAKEQMARPSV